MIKDVNLNELSVFNIKETSNPFTKYIGYFDNEILGYIEYNDIYDSIDIVNVFVLEDYRNKRIGSLLLSKIIDIAKKECKKNITLEVNSINEIAIHLYEKMGFKRVAIREGYYKGTDGYLMELVL